MSMSVVLDWSKQSPHELVYLSCAVEQPFSRQDRDEVWALQERELKREDISRLRIYSLHFTTVISGAGISHIRFRFQRDCSAYPCLMD